MPHHARKPDPAFAPVAGSENEPGHYIRHPAKLVAHGGQVAVLTRSRVWPASHISPAPEPRRAGSEDFRRWPSRMGNQLVYRDGRIETLA